MAFRSSEYLQRNELVRYQLDDVIRAPANGQNQDKNGYKFTINDLHLFRPSHTILTIPKLIPRCW